MYFVQFKITSGKVSVLNDYLHAVNAISRLMNSNQEDAEIDIEELHNTLAHLSGSKLYEYLKLRGVKIGRNACMKVVKRCTTCSQTKKNFVKEKFAMDVDYSCYTFQSLQMDCIGVLPVCEYKENTYKYILVIIDIFSKWGCVNRILSVFNNNFMN